MILAGFDYKTEPHLRNLIHGVQKNHLNKLLKKSKIKVTNSRNLFGIADQSGKLKSGQVFVQLSLGNGASHVICNKVAVARSPAIHPGGI